MHTCSSCGYYLNHVNQNTTMLHVDCVVFLQSLVQELDFFTYIFFHIMICSIAIKLGEIILATL